ncbi:MAG: hypothetical protein MK078_16445 [Crocinitomicaceae bacterium]|nr:hypothetical protein [Crocinitomicaceae bacterium]
MKLKNSLIAALLVGGVMVVAPSCNRKGCTDPTANNYDEKAKKEDPDEPCTYDLPTGYTVVTIGGVSYNQLDANLTQDMTLDAASNWLLSGGTFVNDGVTLTIEAGTTVYTADDGTVPFLSVSQGGKLMAVGTASSPIVFTPISATPAPGDWGGIILNGYAPINTGATAEGEGGTGTYGGAIADDNSGTLQYVRVEYAGKLLSTDNELNGFSFNGVGSGTSLSYLQAYRGNDDGFEFFGGTVSLSNAVSSGNGDDSFDWTHGWVGTGTNWIVEQDATLGDRGIEADNNGDNNDAMPMSAPSISKLTITGRGSSAEKDAIKLREGTSATIDNVLITGAKDGIDIQHDVTAANVTAGTLTITNVTASSDVTNPYAVNVAAGTDSTNTANMLNTAVNGAGTGADTGWTSGWTKAL